MIKIRLKYCLIYFSLFLFFSCQKKEEFTSWDADILTPLVKSTFTINNLITDSTLLQIASDSSVMLVYDSDLYEFSVDSILTIQDTTLVHSFYSPLQLFFNPGTSVMPPVNDETKYDLNGVELTLVRIKSGISQLEITSHFNEPVIVDYAIPSAKLKLTGIPFTQRVTVPPAPNGSTITVLKDFDLSGYEIDLKGSGGNKVNTIKTSISANLCDTTNCKGVDGDTLYTGEGLAIKNSFLGIVPEYARGYFGNTIFDIGPEETSFDLFKGVKGGLLVLEKASVKLTIENGLGVDSRLVINALHSKNSYNATQQNLVSTSYLNTSININRATETGIPLTPASPSTKTILLDNTNSNVKNLLENLPDALGYQLKITTNPLGNLSGSNDFIYADGGLKARLNIQVPLSLSADNISFTDTAITNFGDIKDRNKINYGKILVHINNGFPFDATIQVYLLNDKLSITDSLILGNAIASGASVDISGKVIDKQFSMLEIPVTKEKMEKIFATKKMLIRATLNTINKPQLIKLYSGYTMNIKLIGDFNYRVEQK